jgi:RNA polymerase sigma factor (sigma-70 family)
MSSEKRRLVPIWSKEIGRLSCHCQWMDDPSGRVREIEQLYRNHLPELWRVAAAVSGSRDAAPDLVQEAFVRAVRRLDSFRGDGSLEGWLWRIVVNVARNGRRGPDVAPLTDQIEGAPPSPTIDVRGELAHAMSRLSERQRLVLFLRYYADLDYATIAEALAISSGTVGATLTTARGALALALEVKEATS